MRSGIDRSQCTQEPMQISGCRVPFSVECLWIVIPCYCTFELCWGRQGHEDPCGGFYTKWHSRRAWILDQEPISRAASVLVTECPPLQHSLESECNWQTSVELVARKQAGLYIDVHNCTSAQLPTERGTRGSCCCG